MMAFDSSMSVVAVDDYGTMIRIIRNLPGNLPSPTLLLMATPRSKKMRGKRYGPVISN